jgi:hypothetical protein
MGDFNAFAQAIVTYLETRQEASSSEAVSDDDLSDG